MFSTLKTVFPETECPRNGCLSAKTLFNSQRETYFLLKPDAPKTNAFHVKDVVNIEPFLFDPMPPKMDAFMKDVLNVKPVLLKQNAPEMDAFQQRLLNSQRETYFLLKPDAPKTNAFHVRDVVDIEPFLLTQCPQNGCLYERCSQCEASSFKAKCPRNGCLSAKTF